MTLRIVTNNILNTRNEIFNKINCKTIKLKNFYAYFGNGITYGFYNFKYQAVLENFFFIL